MKAQHKFLILFLIVFAVMMQGCTGHAGFGEELMERDYTPEDTQEAKIIYGIK